VGSAPADADVAGFRSDLGDVLAEHGTRSIEEIDVGELIDEMNDIVRRHHIVMPSSVSLLLKTLVVLQGTARLLSPSFDLAGLLEPFKAQLVRQRLDPRRWMKKLQRGARDVDRLLSEGPRHLVDILDRVRAGKLRMRHEHANLEAVANRLVEGVLIASLFLGSSLLLSGAFPPQWFGVSIVGGLGFLAAGLLGWRLFRTIARERRGG
jgi:ubiquinone biosynthesis protein